jgi:hypothetical protein
MDVGVEAGLATFVYVPARGPASVSHRWVGALDSGRAYSTRICPDLYEGALAEAEILIAKQTPAVSRITHLNNLSWSNAPLSRTNKQFQAIRSLDLHQVGSSQS